MKISSLGMVLLAKICLVSVKSCSVSGINKQSRFTQILVTILAAQSLPCSRFPTRRIWLINS